MRNNYWMALVFLIVFSVCLPLAVYGANPVHKGNSNNTSSLSNKVNINTANANKLTTLPGIGPKTAQRIIDWRKKHGHFKKLEDLMSVRGIGKKKFAKIKSLITI